MRSSTYSDRSVFWANGRKTGFPPTSLANWQVDDLPTFRPSDENGV
jgi:hypothetical protein